MKYRVIKDGHGEYQVQFVVDHEYYIAWWGGVKSNPIWESIDRVFKSLDEAKNHMDKLVANSRLLSNANKVVEVCDEVEV